MHRRHVITAFAALPMATACASAAGTRPRPPELSVTFDGAAVASMIFTYRRTSISEAEIDVLMDLRGVQAAVDNTTRFVPESDRAAFRVSIRQFVETRNPTMGRFGLRSSAANIAPAEQALAGLLKEEARIAREMVETLGPYWPATGPLAVTAYFVMAGASDGFIMDDDQAEVFVALDRSQGDVLGVQVNLTHELYHVGQKLTRGRVTGLAARVADRPSTPAPIRLLTSVLDEGTANYAADPTRMVGSGPYFSMWRDRFLRNAAPERTAENFALFDRMAARLQAGSITWEQAYADGFSGTNDARLYFVGYQMAKALDRQRGAQAIAGAFGQHPAAFFQDYVAASRDGQGVRFATDTEAWLLSLPRS